MFNIIGSIVSLLLLGIYLAPTIIAVRAKKKNVIGIVVLNILTGWTFVGWIIALVWAITGDKE